MSTPPRIRLAHHLNDQRPEGAFSTQLSAHPGMLNVIVKGVGVLPRRIYAADATKLKAVASPAHFGRGTETLHDTDVRDTWEITPDQVTLDGPRLDTELAQMLVDIRDDLGLPYGATLTAELQSLLVYGKGQFFAPHQDTEKNDAMVATLVVGLPSAHTGGELIVSHAGQRQTHRSSPTALTFTAFYADCVHEIRPVRSGHRVTLVFNLLLADDSAPATALDDVASQLLADHFATPQAMPWSRSEPTTPNRLVVLLDHEYSQHGLSRGQFKGHDAERVAIVRAASERNDCRVAVALSEIHECWDSYAEGDPDGLVDNSTALTWWQPDGADATGIALSVSDLEVCAPTPSLSLEPYESDHTGYMGNYGNTEDYWYRRAALVIWPRSKEFALRAEADPAAALDEIADALDSTDESVRAQAVVDAAALPPFLSRLAGSLLASCLSVAVKVDNAALAAELLSPFHLDAVTPAHAQQISDVAAAYGAKWTTSVVDAWLEHVTLNASWDQTLPELCARLREFGASAVADQIVDRLRQLIPTLFDTSSVFYSTPSGRRDQYAELAPAVAAILNECDQPSVDAIRAVVARQSDEVEALLLGILRSLPTDSPAIDGIADDLTARLTAVLDEPERAADDWSIPFIGCGCPLCTRLEQFTSSPDQIRADWPLKKDHRQHLHIKIDSAELPIKHTTLRTGRPYTLIVEKQQSLFTRNAARRRHASTTLAWLTELRG